MLTIITAMAGCSSPPSGEDVLVLRAGDYVGIPDDPQAHPSPSEEVPADTLPRDSLECDSLPLPDSTLMSADSLAVPPDSAEAAGDSLPTVDLPGGMNLLAVEIRGSLYGSLEEARDVAPDVLGAHCVRYLWWDINPWTGIIAGDSLRILYSTEPGPRENCISALEYIPVAGSSNRRFSVYVYRRSGDNFPSIWYSDGTEVVRLLNRMPLSTFEEVTGIFGERRGSGEHHGVDFKAPAGVQVRTVFGGTVNRVDWNPEYNGRCVEIRTPGGSYEVFLHLDQISGGVSPGRTVEQGSQVGTVGNSGRSYASHLHYQINDSEGNPMDPYACLGSRRRSLEGDDMVRFTAVRDSLDILLRGL
jgi:hypothetical protein